MSRDQRLVQTAVMGSAESEIPVLLPMRAEPARAYRKAHVEDSFWCGKWLGGCQGRLTIKAPANKVAHFAHVPGPERVPCRRTSVGISGADHLYIKQQLLRWLAAQGIAAAARLPEATELLGGEVLFEPGGHGCLRVLLDASGALPVPVDGTQLVLGPHVAHDPQRLTLDGYVLRIRCDTDGDARRVMIGTQTHGNTQWFTLDECRLTPWGLSTPAVEEVRRLRSSSRPTAFPHRAASPQVRTAARPVAAPQGADDRSSAFDALRQAIDGEESTSKLRHCLTHAEAATVGGATAEENSLLRRAADLLLVRDRGVGVKAPAVRSSRRGRDKTSGRRAGASPAGMAAEAVNDLLEALERRRGHLEFSEQQRLVAQLQAKAAKAGPWLTRYQRRRITAWAKRTQPAPPPVLSPEPSSRISPRPSAPAPQVPARPVSVTRPTPDSSRRKDAAPAASPTSLDAVADGARDVLEHAARLGVAISWDRLCAEVKGLRELSEEQQRQALKSSWDRSRSGKPLAALITAGGGEPHAHALHVIRASTGPRGLAVWRQAVDEVHAAFRPRNPPSGARPGGNTA